jgi:hypothetical protein
MLLLVLLYMMVGSGGDVDLWKWWVVEGLDGDYKG